MSELLNEKKDDSEDDDNDDNDVPTLSAETLLALRGFALESGVGVGGDDEDVVDVIKSVRDHFQVQDRNDVFTMDYTATTDSSRKVQFASKGIKRELGQTLSSTGLTIASLRRLVFLSEICRWRAAEHLCQFIIDHPERFNGKSVCELGAGLGVVSIMIEKACTSTELVSTDGCKDTVALLTANKIDNDCAFDTAFLWWGENEHFMSLYPKGFDVLVAADVIYEEEQIEPLLSTVHAALSDDGEFILAFCRRNVPIDKVLVKVTEKYGWKWSVIENSGAPSTEPIYSIRKR